MVLDSPAFGNGQAIPERHGKRFENVPIPIEWRDVPDGTRSFALSMVDVDPVARGYIHWLVIDIPAEARSIGEAGALPAGARDVRPYTGPFPPSGTHDYEITLSALDSGHVPLPAGATAEDVHDALAAHALGQATLTGSFTA